MPDPHTSLFWLPADITVAQVLHAAEFPFSAQPSGSATPTILLDTFDWRLHARGWHAEWRNGTLTLFTAPGDLPQRQSVPTPPPFRCDELPAGAVSATLKPVIKMRALMPVAPFRETRTEIRVLDDLQKTTARLIEHTIEPDLPEAPAPLRLVELRPIRGYPKAARAVTRTLTEHGAEKATAHWRDDLIRACGNTPGGYSNKITVQLSPDMPAAEATKLLLKTILSGITTNQPYIAQDIDTEFLHDFRVSVRRTRAALSQIKAVFPVDDVAAFKRDFSFLGKLTNTLRDLDVYLLAADSYRKMLPPHMHPAIEPLFDHLRAQRADALAMVVTTLNGERYPQIIERWEAFLNAPIDPTPANALLPVETLAKTRIYRQYRKIVKMGNHLLKHPNDAELHELRLVAKKLRYLLEFFASLFPPKDMKRLIKQLKILQDNLGEFNDVCVQEEFLFNTALHHPPKVPWSAETTLAIGALIGVFDAQKTRVKADFAAIFTKFSAPKNQALFKKLFAPSKDGIA